jgi:hypothetical protein
MERGMRSAIAFFIFFFIFFFALPGNAQHVYKCAKGGDVSFQSAPCERGQHLVKQWEATPTPEPPAAESRRHQAKEKQALVVDKGRTRSVRHARATSSISAADNQGPPRSQAGLGGTEADVRPASQTGRCRLRGVQVAVFYVLESRCFSHDATSPTALASAR